MLRRNPTRIELKMDDILEFHLQRMENADAKDDYKKIMKTTDQFREFVSKNKVALKSTIDALQPQNLPTTASGSAFGGAFLVASGSASTSPSAVNASPSAPEVDSSSASSNASQ